ncbi:MAG: site-specific integrase [Cellvibrionaceae bacterium]|nr:site-specific integrase [Cellvibrionaceae bacterium]
MADIEQYIQSATRENTRKAYRQAIEKFEVDWGGFLPTTADKVADYLFAHREALSINTLRLHLAALSEWHSTQGFPDPTKAPRVKKLFKGIRLQHPQPEKRAKPLMLETLEAVVAYIDQELVAEATLADPGLTGKLLRNRALILLSFWRAFRSDEICRMNIEHTRIEENHGMVIYLPRTKVDRQALGQEYRVPALQRLCPVSAYRDWLYYLNETEGPVFRKVDQWGNVGKKGLHADSIIPLIRSALHAAGVEHAEQYTSHSFRRGFATWANGHAWDFKDLMAYVGWSDPRSAMRYIDKTQQVGDSINASLKALDAPG